MCRMPPAPNQIAWMGEHSKRVDRTGPTYQMTQVGDSKVKWGPFEGAHLGDKRPRHMVISSDGWPKPVW
jgi:hypothetical protein